MQSVSPEEFQRIDRPHGIHPLETAAKNRRATPVSRRTSDDPADDLPQDSSPRHDDWSADALAFGFADADHWLRLHATDLVDWLTRWSDDLDARESQLNARIAKQDLRERQFRLQRQLAERELREQQQEVDRLRQRIEAHARRLAFQNDR